MIKGNISTPLGTSHSLFIILCDIELNRPHLVQGLFWGKQYKKWNIKMIFMNLQKEKKNYGNL